MSQPSVKQRKIVNIAAANLARKRALREFRRSGPLLLAYQVNSGVRKARKELTMDLLARFKLRVTQIVYTDAQHVFSLQLQSYCGRVLLR